MKTNLILLCTLILFVGCQSEETITPLFDSESIADSQSKSDSFSGGPIEGRRVSSDNPANDDPNDTDLDLDVFNSPIKVKEDKPFFIRGSYYFEDMNIEQAVGKKENFVNKMLSKMVSLIVKIGGNFKIETDPIKIDLNEIDTEQIKALYIQDIKLCVADRKKTRATLKFLKRITIKIRDVQNPKREITAIDYNSKDKRNKVYSKKYGYQCIKIPVLQRNLLKFISKNTKQIELVPMIKLGAAPTQNFSIVGSLDFKIGMKVDF